MKASFLFIRFVSLENNNEKSKKLMNILFSGENFTIPKKIFLLNNKTSMIYS